LLQGNANATPISPSTGIDYLTFNMPFKKPKKSTRLRRRITADGRLQLCTDWEEHGREPYHEYIHRLVGAGWDNLKKLDEYMCRDVVDQDLTISVLDITEDLQLKCHPDIHNELALKNFLFEENCDGVKVRLFMAEQLGSLSSGVMEAFGSALELDPRFFQWSIYGNKNLLSPAERHRVPFTSIGFTILTSSLDVTDTEFFRVSVYILQGETDDHWTGERRAKKKENVDACVIVILTLSRHPSFQLSFQDGLFNEHAYCTAKV
jgi:hypothetical protein